MMNTATLGSQAGAKRQNPNASYRTFYAGQEILREGEAGDEAYMVVSGRVEIRRCKKGSMPKTVAVLGRGEIVGELALLDEQTRSATAIAIEDTKVSVLSRREFQRRAENMDPLLKSIYGAAVRRLRAAYSKAPDWDADIFWDETVGA